MISNTLFFNLTPDKNGGESITLSITQENGYTTEKLELNSYGSCATISTFGVFTSENMFKLAKELQVFELNQKLKSN